jgi:hypothetical protein
MTLNSTKILVSTCTWAFFVWGCGADPQEADQEGARKANAPKIDTADAVVEGQAPKTLNVLCENVWDLSSTSKELAEHANKFCSAKGQPMALMVNKLPKVAYSGGEEDPQLILLAQPEHDNTNLTTRLLVAGAVKLPISAQKYFDSATELMDDRERAKDLGVELVGGLKKLDVLEEFEAIEDHHVKSWKTHVIVEREVSDQIFVSEYQSMQEHYMIEEGSIYVVSTYLDKAIKGIVDTRMFTTIVQFKSQAYIFAIIDAKTENQGLPTVATQELSKVMREGLTNAYNNATIFDSL